MRGYQKDTVVVLGLNEETEEGALVEYFERYGPVDTVTIKHKPHHAYAFVRFEQPAAAAAALGHHGIDGVRVETRRALRPHGHEPPPASAQHVSNPLGDPSLEPLFRSIARIWAAPAAAALCNIW